MFSRTKTLNHYTNDANEIFDSAKFLLLNEINSSNNNLKLRLIGVRVSALREEPKGKNGLARFLCKNNYEFEIEIEEDEYSDFRTDLFTKCPICDDYFEGNQEFIQQHIEFCMFR